MSDSEHLDHALAGEFEGHAVTIHRLKTGNAHFRALIVDNHALWLEIQQIESGQRPADDAILHGLQKRRLRLLDEIAATIARAEKD